MRVKKASAVYVSGQVNQFLARCKDERLRKNVNEILDLLRMNYELGDKVPKRQGPRSYVKQLGLNNLYRCDLIEGWRLTYTLSFDGVGIRVDVIEVMTHREYEKRFGY
jgi:hypothetical protein